jgi:hypothetical protein
MVPSWFVAAIAVLIVVACIVLIWDEFLSVVQWLSLGREFQMWERIESAFSASEILSFGFLFGFGVLCLEFHRYASAIVFFSLGCIFLSVRMIAIVYKTLAEFTKWIFVLLIAAAAIALSNYLGGLTLDAQREYLAGIDEKGKAEFREFVVEHRPKPEPVIGLIPNSNARLKRAPSKDKLRVTKFEVLPYTPGRPLEIKMHLLNGGESTIEIEDLWNDYTVVVVSVEDWQNNYEKRKSTEDNLWKLFEAGVVVRRKLPNEPMRSIMIPAGQDTWNLINSQTMLTDVEVSGKAPGKAVYFLDKMFKKDSSHVLAEACIWMVPEDRGAIYYCVGHN